MNRTKINTNHTLTVGTKENGTNYNKYAKVFRKGENTPRFGMIFKGDEPLNNIIEWAQRKVSTMDETLDRIFKEMDEL